MTLQDLYAALSALPKHDNLKLEEYRIVQDIYDPGNPAEAHFYLTGPNSFYLYLTQIDEGDHRDLAEYIAEANAFE